MHKTLHIHQPLSVFSAKLFNHGLQLQGQREEGPRANYEHDEMSAISRFAQIIAGTKFKIPHSEKLNHYV